jgi:hypothetical protein
VEEGTDTVLDPLHVLVDHIVGQFRRKIARASAFFTAMQGCRPPHVVPGSQCDPGRPEAGRPKPPLEGESSGHDPCRYPPEWVTERAENGQQSQHVIVEALHRRGLRGSQFHALSLGSVALCIGLWIRAKTVDQDERGNAERRALFVGLWAPTLWQIGDSLRVSELRPRERERSAARLLRPGRRST